MTEQPERQRIRPTVAGRERLLADLDALPAVHVIDGGALGEYAALLQQHGPAGADAVRPEVAAHLDAGCARCDEDLDELLALLDEPDGTPPPAAPDDHGAASPDPSRAVSLLADPAAGPPGVAERGPAADRFRRPNDDQPSAGGPPPRPRTERSGRSSDSGSFLTDLPDPRALEAEAARRQRLRRVRDILLIAAAVSVLLLGLSLVGIAFLARQAQEPVRVPLQPQPSGAPSQPSAPVAPLLQPGGGPGAAPTPPAAPTSAGGRGAVPPDAGRALPDGLNCPPSHPIKGNRESMIYHLPGGTSYPGTRPEVCFALPADAEAAGYRRSQR